MRKPIYAMADADAPICGEGLTRTSNPGATLWRLRVEMKQGSTMRETIRAMTGQEAQRFSLQRYPNAARVILEGPV